MFLYDIFVAPTRQFREWWYPFKYQSSFCFISTKGIYVFHTSLILSLYSSQCTVRNVGRWWDLGITIIGSYSQEIICILVRCCSRWLCNAVLFTNLVQKCAFLIFLWWNFFRVYWWWSCKKFISSHNSRLIPFVLWFWCHVCIVFAYTRITCLFVTIQ